MIDGELVFEHVDFKYDVKKILEDVSFSIPQSEVSAFVGPSGSGKSTLINILGFIDRGYEGEYFFNNENYQKSSDNKLAEIRNHTVGFVFQNFKLIQNNTILENVSIPLIYNGLSNKARKSKVLD
ncbi:ATP-binding cassette domain-containing protein, partial [Staphylococcus sp. EG-SA-32]|nr:ATP-binding cassette domain-containing protein [Staphylococcus sp. EG-SA-32]